MKKISTWRWVFITSSVVIYLLFFRPGIAMRVSGDFDDRAYLCSAQKWVGIFSEECPQTSHFSGVTITWFPALFLARLFSLVTDDSFEAWAGFWVGLTSFFCWVLCLFVIKETILLYLKKDAEPKSLENFISSAWFPVLFLMNIPVLYFATTRTFMVHTPELLWSLLFIYFFKANRFAWGFVSLGVLLFTRPGNFGAVLLVPAFLEKSLLRKKFPKVLWVFGGLTLVAIGFFLVFKLLVMGYHGTYLIPMILDFQWQSLKMFLFAEDFGVVWSQWVWLTGLLLWIRYFKKGSSILAAAGVWLYISVLATLFWPTRGGTFGYRYLIGSYAAVLLIILEMTCYWGSFLGKKTLRLTKVFLIFGALWSAVQCWIYPAPKPYWPWEKPLHNQVGIPYGQVMNWLKQFPDLVKMNRFSQAGQFLEKLGFISSSEFTRKGGIRGYALSGAVGEVNFWTTIFLLVVFLWGARLIIISQKNTPPVEEKRHRPRKKL